MLEYIIWTAEPEMFTIPGLGREVRWYGLLFAMGFLLGYYIISHIWQKEERNMEELDRLVIYMMVAVVVGARLGHCLFYQPGFYLSNPVEILKIWEGGLASHGATIGILLALYLFIRKTQGYTYLWLLDRIVIVVALGGAFIRFGNLMNSEIIGKPAEVPWAFVFTHDVEETLESPNFFAFIEEVDFQATGQQKTISGLEYPGLNLVIDVKKGLKTADLKPAMKGRILPSIFQQNSVFRKHLRPSDAEKPYEIRSEKGFVQQMVIKAYGVPRHPAQLYESLSTLLIFLVLLAVWNRNQKRTPQGLLFGLFCVYVFGLRIVWETMKENQVAFEDQMTLNMGQILSIPMVLVGLGSLYLAKMRRPKGT